MIDRFNKGLQQEIQRRKVRLPYACCLSTEGLDGFPNARFVSLKEVYQEQFVVTGALNSRKGVEINHHDKVALTFWWPETAQQVRIQGVATQLPEEMADRYFEERNRESQIVSVVSRQGEMLTAPEILTQAFDQLADDQHITTIKRPDDWGAYGIAPVRVEFLVFSESRFHDRTLYELINGQWSVKKLQP
ncbi:pyridoxal 5'-phosphate synthase [Chitinophaga varians]|nr:pyridoxal 5'-phosphate synthase [Chitinophaga varians]